MDGARGVECLWGDLKTHPRCPHGPTLLFGRYVNGELQKFYACSACRDRKLCTFYVADDQQLSKIEKKKWQKERQKLIPYYHHQQLFIHLNKIKAESMINRFYCHDCEKLFLTRERDKHDNHKVTEKLTDYQLSHPTELLKPLNNEKKEAQYLFSKKAMNDVINMLVKLKAKQVLCIGTPRIHECILEDYTDKISSLLLDFDGRFHNFFGPLNYCWYNLFNHHFFNQDAIDVFKDFITQNNGEDTYLICDPPFGGRVEPMSYTIKTICDLHKKLNNNNSNNFSMKIMFMFPYYMEHIMKEKSNPLSVDGGLKDLKMSDYKVDYDNHPLFRSREHGGKQGSPVRIFTNIPLNLLELPSVDGYKFCEDCKKWISSENKHCERCNECTSKNGRTYIHCNICKRCVKPTWKHCKTCKRCLAKEHTCGQELSIVGRCFKCNELGHTRKECTDSSSMETTAKAATVKRKKVKKRKAESELETFCVKKIKKHDLKKNTKRKKCVLIRKTCR